MSRRWGVDSNGVHRSIDTTAKAYSLFDSRVGETGRQTFRVHESPSNNYDFQVDIRTNAEQILPELDLVDDNANAGATRPGAFATSRLARTRSRRAHTIDTFLTRPSNKMPVGTAA